MSDPVARLNVALEGRYTLERELGDPGRGPTIPPLLGVARRSVLRTPSSQNVFELPILKQFRCLRNQGDRSIDRCFQRSTRK